MWVAWIEAPAFAHRHVCEQPFDWPRTGPGKAILDLLHLLGDVDMDRSITRHPHDLIKLARSYGAKTVWSDAEFRPRHGGCQATAGFHGLREIVERMNEPSLPRGRCRAAEAGMRIKDRQERQADPGLGARRPDAPGHLGDIGIVRPILVVMEIVEFTDPRKTGLQHFHIKL